MFKKSGSYYEPLFFIVVTALLWCSLHSLYFLQLRSDRADEYLQGYKTHFNYLLIILKYASALK